ncbi:MAG: S41 family peptidase [Bacteroidota bacterium]
MRLDNKYIPVYIAVILAIGMFIGSFFSISNQTQLSASNNSKAKLNKLIDFIHDEYVDDLDTDSIVNRTVDNILAQLDPHSVYIPSSEQAEVAENMKGDFVGIGVRFYFYKDSVAIIQPMENGPSAKAGIKAGDRLLYADGTKLYGRKLPTDTLFSKLKGKEGSEVALTVYRKSEKRKIDFKIKRGVIPLKSVDVALMLNSSTAYIKINRFAETTFEEFKTNLLRLKKQGAKTLVIDLRDNGGGYMEEAIDIADELLANKKLIVFTKNKKAKIEKTYATGKGAFETGRLFVLINENSASASEILAGAVQDNDRGTIVGRRSFGKGLVQREMEFNDGSAVRLTVARYYTPTGRSIQKPYSKGAKQYFEESESRFKNGELYAKDSIKLADSLKFKTPKGKIVYGGGGIVPDVFVPMEFENADEATAYLMESGIVGNFVFEQLDKNRKAFKGLSFEQFLNKMNNNDVYFDVFEKFMSAHVEGIQLHKSKSIVKRYLNAEFARQLYGEKAYYNVVLKNDVMVKTVLNKK